MKKFGAILLGILLFSLGLFLGYWKHNDLLKESSKNETKIEEIVPEKQEITEETAQYADLTWLNSQLSAIKRPLGWVSILSDQAAFAEEYHVNKGENILGQEKARQLFIMEYILLDEASFSNFVMLEDGQTVTTDYPVDDTTVVYLPYDYFNDQYKVFFESDFDTTHAQHMDGNTETINQEYVYYDNRRGGANGISVEEIIATEAKYDETENDYVASLTMTYSERAEEMLGRNTDEAILKYKIVEGRIILVSFCIQ